MLLSIVTGTYNRKELLISMVNSVRRSLHRGIDYKIVVVDGGSNDGTIEYCQAQPDIHLLLHGELRGAIRAFTDGAYSARGDYVLLANDDVEFIDHSILRAVAYLESHPATGAVAFADDRRATGKPDGYGIQTHTVLKDGKAVHLPYAQVGLFRRWLGDLCGWWGADDPAFISHTYGGDDYLSARIVEYGYTVDAVQGVRVKDLVHNDELRSKNANREDEITKAGGGYRARFPVPPELLPAPVFDNPQSIRAGLRILYLPIFETGRYPHHPIQKRGLREALSRLGALVEIDYLNEPYDLVEVVSAWRPDILVTQCQRDKIDITAARAVHPGMLCLNWNGDVYLDALVDDSTLNWLKAGNTDVQLVVNAAALPIYAAHGLRAAYWQCGFEPTTGAYHIPPERAPDVLFMGSNYGNRVQLISALTSLKVNLHLVGSGWVNYPAFNKGNTTYDFELSTAIRRAAKIEVGDNQWWTDTGFISNRAFESLAAGGALLLHERVDQLERYTGLAAGEHYVEWTDYADLKAKIDYYLSHEDERRAIVERAHKFVTERCSFNARVAELFDDILPGLGL